MINKKIRKNIQGILSYVVLEALFVRGASHIDINALEAIDVVNLFGIVVVFVLILRSLFYPYIIVTEGSIQIIRDFFYRDNVVINEVVGIFVAYSPFTKSYFQLKDGKKVKFDSFFLKRDDADFLKRMFNEAHA